MPSPPPWLRSDAHLAHDVPGHPERPERIRALEAEMERHDFFGCELREPEPVSRELLHAVHPEAHVAFIEELCAGGGGAIDYDTVALEGTYEAALRACGGAVELVDALFAGDDAPRAGVSAMRPPGHHAEPRAGDGLLLLRQRRRRGAARAGRARRRAGAVFDWDVHHGNGTNAIFHADPSVLFVSVHEWPLYPGTGPAHDAGSGEGEGYTVNLPVPARSGDDVYRSLAEHVAADLMRAWEPGLVLISAGFDAHRDDPLATCQVTEAGYAGHDGVAAAGLRRGRRAARARARGRLRPRRAVALDGGADARAGGGGDARRRSTCRCTRWPTGARDRLARWWEL